MLNFTINRWFGIIFRQPSYSTFCDRQTCCQIVSEYNYFKVGRVNFCLSRVWASRESTKANISSMTTLFKYIMKAMTHKLAMSERMTLHTRGWNRNAANDLRVDAVLAWVEQIALTRELWSYDPGPKSGSKNKAPSWSKTSSLFSTYGIQYFYLNLQIC